MIISGGKRTEGLVIATCFFALGIASDARAEASRIDATPIFQDGRLTGCSLVFDVIVQDHRYKAGALTQASGSVTVWGAEGHIGAGIKLGLATIAPDSPPFEKPATAFLVSGLETNAGDLIGTAESPTPGFGNFFYQMSDATMEGIVAITAGRLTVGYTRPGGTTAQTFDLNIPAAESADFGECFKRVAQDFLNAAGAE